MADELIDYCYNRLGIYIGNKCNFCCDHCASDSSLTGIFTMENNDIEKLINGISNCSFSEISFTGGEPTLDINLLNLITGKIFKVLNKKIEVTIVTNAHFAKTIDEAISVLKSIQNLSKVCISFDKYHAHYISENQIQILIDAAKKTNLKIKGLACIETPFDLKFGEIFSNNNIECDFHQLGFYGRARKIKKNTMLEILDIKNFKDYCPDSDIVMYIPGGGFTFCCNDLVYTRLKNVKSKIYFDSIEKLKKSSLNKIIKQTSIMNMFNELNSKEIFYSECEICNKYISRKILNE